MSFSYNSDSPTKRDKLRYLLGDTNREQYINEDSELNMALSQNDNNINMAAAFCCRAIAMSRIKVAMVVKLMDDISIDKSKIPALYMKLASTFESGERNEPVEYWDSADVNVDSLGVDWSEYISDNELL